MTRFRNKYLDFCKFVFFLSDYWRSAPFKKCIKCIKFVWQEGYRGGVIPPPQSILCKPDLSRSIGYTFLLWPLEKNMKGLNWVMILIFLLNKKKSVFDRLNFFPFLHFSERKYFFQCGMMKINVVLFFQYTNKDICEFQDCASKHKPGF